MEHKVETNRLAERKKRKKKVILQNFKPNQVTSKISDNNKTELDMMKQHLKIGHCSSSNESIAISRSNTTAILGIDNTNQKHEYSSSSNSEALRHLEQNASSSVNMLPFNNISSDKNPNKNEISTSLEKNHCEDSIGQGKLIQFENCKKKDFVSCRFCLRKFCYNIPILTDHVSHCKTFDERTLKNILKFNCFICDKVFKKLKDWKSHTVNYFHMQKCMIQNNYFSYVCGGCKAVFFGSKEQISNHCKDVHKDTSRLPCIYKCMKDVFDYFIFNDRKNIKSWTFCALCRNYSSPKVNCISQNHIKKNTSHFKCDSCLIDFICSQDIYTNHLLSCEHIMLDFLRAASNKKIESQTACNLKLPPVILNKFSIDNEKATCNDCKFQMFPNEKAITIHLADECIYKSNIGKKNSTIIKKFKCAVCDKTISDFRQWKFHLISLSHLIKCYDKSDLVSYTCELCSLHCYGDSHHVAEHQDIHPNNSEKKLSMFMAFNFQRINKDLKSKDFYYCEDCETYDEDSNLNHWNKSHQTKLKRITCQPCKTEFFCIEGNELFIKHELSSEHIILKFVKNQRLEQKSSPLFKLKKNTVLQNEEQTPCSSKSLLEIIKNQVPLNLKPYLNWFELFEDKNKADCKECNDSIDINKNSLLNHLLVCDQDSPKNISKTYISCFQCLECQFYSKDYGLWEKHAISHVNAEIPILHSYFCTSCSTLLYGKISDIELHLNNEHKITTINMPLDTVLMAKQFLRKNNACKAYDIFCFCEPCKKIFKATDNSNHFNTDSHASVASDFVELFYCKYCEVEFYSTSIIYERHKLTAEHIMMSYEYSSNDIKDVLNPYQLYAHLLKFVTNQKLYDTTQNIGFFCFVCDYLCTSLNIWKIHINGKKHVNSSKSLCMDHRCKICKTLMFGQRKHMFEHYSNRFHSMLRLFKSSNYNDILKDSDSLLQTTFETKPICNTETTSENVQRAENGNNKLEKSFDDNDLLSKMMNELSLKKPKFNTNETYPTVQTIDKYSLVSNIQHDTFLKEESTTNINKTYSMIKLIDESLLESNTEQDCNTFGESNINTNEELHLDKLPLKINTEQDKSYDSMNDLHSIDRPLKKNTNNYCNFYDLKIRILNEMLNKNKEINLQSVNYCSPCDFITSIHSIWDEHILTSHSNNMDGIKKNLFCDICNLNQIGPSDNLDEHNSTIEHKKMLDFKKLYSSINLKQNKENCENKDESKSSNDAGTSIADTQVKNDEKEMSNRKFMIEIKGAKLKYKKNSWIELKKVFSPYGYFGIYPRPNSVVIMFRKSTSANEVINDKDELEKTHEFSISVLIEEERLPELNKTTEYEFGNKEILMTTINAQIKAINNEIFNHNIYQRLHTVIDAVHRCSGQCFVGGKTYAFGSRMSGLALKESDVDLYFDIANTFGGQLSHDLKAQEDLVKFFGKVFRSQSEFKNIQQITAARVPIVKFVHIPSGLNCDLSFKSGLSTHNTKLVRLYLSLDKRVHWIVCAVVKRWALQNDLKNQSMFTSYALAWLVLFYLMTIDVVPPLELLRNHAIRENKNESDVIFIEDWDCTFCSIEIAKEIWKVPEIPCWDLLFGFFKFYSEFNRLKQFVLCPAIGKALPKDGFYKIPMNEPDIMGFYKKQFGSPNEWSMRLKDHFYGEGLAVQDPFDLFHNITKTIVPKKLQGFSHLCTKTMEVMNKGIQPYYA